MAEKREKPKKEDEEQEPKPDTKTAPAEKQLSRSELEALRQVLQRKFHQ